MKTWEVMSALFDGHRSQLDHRWRLNQCRCMSDQLSACS